MLQGRQFTQRPLPGIEGTTVVGGGSGQPIPLSTPTGDRREDQRGRTEFQLRGEIPGGKGSWSSWQSQAQIGRRGQERSARESQARRDAELGTSHLSKGEGQLAMFMSPNEIHERYQPLDGDRYDAYDGFGTSTPSSGGSDVLHDPYGNLVENDEQLWDRKLEESQLPKSAYSLIQEGREATGTGTYVQRLFDRSSYPQATGTPNTAQEEAEESYIDRRVEGFREAQGSSLHESIQSEGVRSPVRLGQQEGMMGKPEVIGGHHRLAAQTDIDRNQPVPVIHDENIYRAKAETAYPYT